MKNETLLKTYVKRFAQSKTDYHIDITTGYELFY